jgi:hypothetical protein
MKKTALLVALSLSALACDSGSEPSGEGELGSVSLNDSTDATGKADALMGRQVNPYLTELVRYGDDTKSGKSVVTDIDDDQMTMEAPLVELPAFEEALQVTISGDANTDMRFFLAYSDGDSWRIVTVEGQGTFEDGDEPEGGDEQNAGAVTISYFQQISILKSENSISVSSDDAGGQTTTTLGFDASSAKFAVLALPVDSGWGNDLLGEFGYTYEATCDGYECGQTAPVDPDVPVDDYAQARDVNLEAVTIGGDALPYDYPSVDSGFGLGGTEFWQKWAGGHNPTYSYTEGTEAGRKCMLASAIRFEAIMANPPASMVELKENTNWNGRFFNWNDDFSESGSNARGAVLWAWRTGLIKWISQTGRDGTCYLPTLDIVERAAANCLARGEGDGEIEGCQG